MAVSCNLSQTNQSSSIQPAEPGFEGAGAMPGLESLISESVQLMVSSFKHLAATTTLLPPLASPGWSQKVTKNGTRAKEEGRSQERELFEMLAARSQFLPVEMPALGTIRKLRANQWLLFTIKILYKLPF